MIVQYLLRAVVVLIAIPFHESAHALASHLLGDDTAVRARQQSAAGVGVDDFLQAVLVQRGGADRARAVHVPVLYGGHESESGRIQSAACTAV